MIDKIIRRGISGTARLVVGVMASAGLGWLVVRGLDWGLVGRNLAGVSLAGLLLAIGVFLIANYLRALRWRVLFATGTISTARLFVVQNEGIGVNNLMPVRVVSEVVQLAVLTMRDGVNRLVALATLGMERVIDVVASTMILGVAFFFVPEMQSFKPFVFGAVGFSVVVVALVRLFAWGSESLAFVRRYSFVAELALAVKDLERQRVRLLGSLLLSVSYWILVGTSAWILAVSIDIHLSPVASTLLIMGATFFATAVPAAPGAVGTFEWAVVYVLGYFGIEDEVGFVYAVVIHAVFFLPPTIIAAFFLPREGVMSLRRLRGIVASGADAVTRS